MNWLKDFVKESLEPKEHGITLRDIMIATVTLFIMGVVLVWCTYQENNILMTWLYGYYAVIIFALMVVIILKFFFQKKYSNAALSEKAKNRIVKIYEMIFVVFLVLGIPMLMMLKIISFILNYRAKRFENLINSSLIICLDLFMILAFLYPNWYVAVVIVECVMKQFATILWNPYALSLMLFLSLYLLELNLVNGIVLRIMHHHGKTLLKKEVLDKYGKHEAYKTDIDEEIYQEQKRSFEKRRSDALEYDVAYHKKTLWKFQLMCLIGLFAIGIFAPGEVTSQQGDFINVLTWFTVLMLYWDKRKAWK